MKLFGFVLAVTTALTTFAAANADELVTNERAGRADAPNTLVLSTTTSFSPAHPAMPKWSDGYRKLFADFIKKRPDWKIEFSYQSDDTGQVSARMLEQAKSGKAPDCAAIDSFVLSKFIQAGVLTSLSDYFSKDEVADLFPFIRAGITGADGKIYAWWWNTDLRVLYRNKEIVPNAPKTWDELKAAALASKKAGMEGVLFNGSRYEGTTFDWLANFWSQGGELVDADGKPIFAEGANRDKFIKAVAYYKDLVDSGAAPKRVITLGGYDDFNAAAAANTTALFIGGNWQYQQLATMMDKDELAKWTFSEIPGPTPDQHATGTGGWTVASFSKDPVKVKMCTEIVREVYDGPGNVLMDLLPTHNSAYTKYPEFANQVNKTFAEALKSGKARPGAVVYPEISNQIQIMMGDVLSGKKAVEPAVDAAFQASLAAYTKK